MFLQMVLSVVQPVYELTVIEDDMIPRTEEMARSTVGLNLVVLLTLAIFAAVAVCMYFIYCNEKRARVVSLMRDYCKDGYKGWNFFRLKRESERLEAEILEQDMDLFREPLK